MIDFGGKLADLFKQYNCLELTGDVGAGKTTLVKGLAKQLGYDGVVSSPSFSLNNRYQLPDEKVLSHYDFYRLDDVWSVQEQLAEDLEDSQVLVVIEWADSIVNVLPSERARVEISYTQNGRMINVSQ